MFSTFGNADDSSELDNPATLDQPIGEAEFHSGTEHGAIDNSKDMPETDEDDQADGEVPDEAESDAQRETGDGDGGDDGLPDNSGPNGWDTEGDGDGDTEAEDDTDAEDTTQPTEATEGDASNEASDTQTTSGESDEELADETTDSAPDEDNEQTGAGEIDADELGLSDELASGDVETVEEMADANTPTTQAGFVSFADVSEVDTGGSDDDDSTSDLTEAIEQRTDDLQNEDLDDAFEDFANFSGADNILGDLFGLPADQFSIAQGINQFAGANFDGGI